MFPAIGSNPVQECALSHARSHFIQHGVRDPVVLVQHREIDGQAPARRACACVQSA